MLKTEKDKKICEKYSKRDAAGLVRCRHCPLLRGDPMDGLCKAVAHYNRKYKQWVPDWWESKDD